MTFPIYQVVGYKNSGKTTLMEKLIQYFSNHNVRVGTLKHHGHGGALKTVEGTDSFRHSQSGSHLSAVQGKNELQLTTNFQMELTELIKMYTFFNIELLLIEGYKYADYPKIALVKDEDDIHLLHELTNIKAIGVRDDKLIDMFDHFTFSLNNVEQILPQLADIFQGKEN